MSYPKYSEAHRRNPMASGLIYQHMSSHYRRILNAKPAVDTSPPQTFKPRPSRVAKPSLRHSNSSFFLESRSICSSQDSYFVVPTDEQLIDKIVASKKYSPAVVCGMEWLPGRRKQPPAEKKSNSKLINLSNGVERTRHLSRSVNQRPRVPADILDRHEEEFQAIGSQFWPRVLKTDAESKLRHMRVYHPPKRKAWASSKEESVDVGRCKCQGVCTCSQVGDQQDCKEPSQTSSRDSAYNGGTSSTTDSRSPTPCQHKQRMASGEYIDENSVRCVSHIATQTDPVESRRSSKRNSLNRRGSDDSAYTKLIHDITQEVLEKGQCTDKLLGRIISRHVIANINILDKDRMLKEVSKLRKQLGIGGNGDNLEDFYSEDDDLSSSCTLLQYKRHEKNKDYDKDSSESESWTTMYSHLSKRKINVLNDIEVSETSVDNQQKHSNTPPLVWKAERKASLSELSEAPWKSKGIPNDEEEKDSDSSKHSTIKEIGLLASQLKEDESESDEISYEVDQSGNSSDET